MKVVDSPPGASQWAQFIEPVMPELPPGFENVQQIAAAIGRSIPHTGKLMRALFEAGKLDRIIYPSRGYPTPHYRPKDYVEPKAKQQNQKHRLHR